MALVTKNIGTAVETTWGTLVAPTHYPRIRNFAPNFDMGTKMVDDTANTQKGFSKMVNLKKSVEGDITFYAYPDDIGVWLAMIFGAPAAALHAGETVVYDNTFSQATARSSFTLQVDKGVEVDTYLGTYGNTLKLTAANDIVEGTIGVQSKDKSTTSTYTPSVTEIQPFTFDQVQVGFATTLATATTNAASSTLSTPLDEWSISFSLENERRWQSGSKIVSRIDQQIAKLTGDFKQFYLATTWENNYLNATQNAMYFQIQNGAITIGSTSHYTLGIGIPEMQLQKDERPYEAGKLIVESNTFEAMYNTTSTYMVQMVLTNLTNGYAT